MRCVVDVGDNCVNSKKCNCVVFFECVVIVFRYQLVLIALPVHMVMRLAFFRKVLASVQKRRHGCVLLLFFGLCVTRESLALVSWRSKTWWWALDRSAWTRLN